MLFVVVVLILTVLVSAEPYPSEALRADLSVQLNLSDRQLQMWFCHRRLKDRKSSTPTKRQRKESTTPSAADLVAGNEHNSFPHELDSRRTGGGVTVVRRFNEPSPSEVRAIGYVEAQLGERLRDDGPILGMEFDPLPPGAFGTPIGICFLSSSICCSISKIDFYFIFFFAEMPSHRKAATRPAYETNLYVKPVKVTSLHYFCCLIYLCFETN